MRDGQASATAQGVAAQRLRFDRLPAPYGDPMADERLCRDVASESTTKPSQRMATYLAARTSFFDRSVVDALARDVTQVVGVGAGYDGRAWRYAKPGVRWFEVDHPDTQSDKRRRLRQLGIGTDQVTFLAADFAMGHVGPLLAGAGLDPAQPSLMLCEGVAVYLDRSVLTDLLEGLAEVAASQSQLAISLSVATDSSELSARRAEFQARVAALGEPVRDLLTADDAVLLLAATGWRAIPALPDSTHAQQPWQAGFVTAERAH